MMRAKMTVHAVTPAGAGELLTFGAVGPSQYPADGSDENNTFARWTPNAQLTMNVVNPALVGKIKAGDTFYVDFTKVD